MALEIVKTNYFTFNTMDTKFYLCKVVDDNDIFTIDNVDGSDVITKADFNGRDFLQLKDVFVIVQTPDGPVPVDYSKMPGGGKVLWLSKENIASFNVIDNNSKLVTALDQILSGVITEAPQPAGRKGR